MVLFVTGEVGLYEPSSTDLSSHNKNGFFVTNESSLFFLKQNSPQVRNSYSHLALLNNPLLWALWKGEKEIGISNWPIFGMYCSNMTSCNMTQKPEKWRLYGQTIYLISCFWTIPHRVTFCGYLHFQEIFHILSFSLSMLETLSWGHISVTLNQDFYPTLGEFGHWPPDHLASMFN